MARFGYIRVSSKEQKVDRQQELMKDAKIDKFYIEKESGKNIEDRQALKELLSTIHFGDVVVVAELDRLSRSYDDLDFIISEIQRKEATLEVLNLPLTQTDDKSINKLMNTMILEIYKYIAESERKRIKERQRQGIELAKAKGVYKGGTKKFKMDDPQLQLAFKLIDGGDSIRFAAKQTGINYETLRRYNKERKNDEDKEKLA